MNTQLESDRPIYRQQSQAGHYVVAAAIILAAVLLILFLPRNNGCCCCCQRPVATTSTTTLGELPVSIPPGALGHVLQRRMAQFAALPAVPASGFAPTSEAEKINIEPVTIAEPVAQVDELVGISGWFAAAPDLLIPPPSPGVVIVVPGESVNVDEAGSSLWWLAIGSVATIGGSLTRRAA